MTNLILRELVFQKLILDDLLAEASRDGFEMSELVTGPKAQRAGPAVDEVVEKFFEGVQWARDSRGENASDQEENRGKGKAYDRKCDNEWDEVVIEEFVVVADEVNDRYAQKGVRKDAADKGEAKADSG